MYHCLISISIFIIFSENGISSSTCKRGVKGSPSQVNMRHDDEYQNIERHSCGAIIMKSSFSRLSGPPTLLKNEDAIGPGQSKYTILFAQPNFFIDHLPWRGSSRLFASEPVSWPCLAPSDHPSPSFVYILFVCTICVAIFIRQNAEQQYWLCKFY
jgi:hypothetical protein